MKHNVRITTVVPKVAIGNPAKTMDGILDLLKDTPITESELVILPRLILTPPSSASLLSNPVTAESAKKALHRLRAFTHDQSAYFMIGLITEDCGRPVSTYAVLYKGSVIAKLPFSGEPEPLVQSGFSDAFIPSASVFLAGGQRIQVFTEQLPQLPAAAAKAAENLCDILLVPLYEPIFAGKISHIRELAKSLSRSLGLAIVLINGGIGDTSSPYFYSGFSAVFENGSELDYSANRGQGITATVDLDPDVIHAFQKRWDKMPTPPFHKIATTPKSEILRPVPTNPFLPAEPQQRQEYITELFYYQLQSLAARMNNTGIHKLVLGISGGIDSTAALMVSVAACDYLGLPRANIHGITLPGLGTSDRTYYNALALLEQLGVTRSDISIRPAVLQHFEDIGHSGKQDTAYENAQARERTQILLDIANMENALVIGTGDLSEEALGFCTFGGDHLASYNVNVCMTKTMLREQVLTVAEAYSEVDDILHDVLETPVSPELLPPKDGEIEQKTEEILGPYELLEFFLYYLTAYHMKPSKIYAYACKAFEGKMQPGFIRNKLELFLKRFCANQFKRACAPDAAAIAPVNLLNVNYTIPSDLDVKALLTDLEAIE